MTIEDLDDCLSRMSVFALPRMPAGLESAFLEESRDSQRRMAICGLLLGTAFYIALLLVDWSIVHDVRDVSHLIRVGVGLPVSGAAIWVMLNPRRSSATYQLAAAILACGDSLTFSAVMATSHELASLTYLSANLIVLGFTINLIGLSTRAAAIVCAIIVATMTTAASLSPISSPAVVATYLIVGTMVALTCIFANHCLQVERRRSFLTARREELRLRQISQQRALLDRLAAIDPLTELANRRGFEAMLEADLAAAADASLSVAVIDIDHFKTFNDTYGHLMGDEVLKSVAAHIGQSCDSHVRAGRLGGEEFVLAAVGIEPAVFVALAERLRAAIPALPVRQGFPSPVRAVTVSIGIAHGSATTVAGAKVLFQAADEALYAAKRSGRNRIEVSAAETDERVHLAAVA